MVIHCYFFCCFLKKILPCTQTLYYYYIGNGKYHSIFYLLFNLILMCISDVSEDVSIYTDDENKFKIEIPQGELNCMFGSKMICIYIPWNSIQWFKLITIIYMLVFCFNQSGR